MIKPGFWLYALATVVILAIAAFMVWPLLDSSAEQATRPAASQGEDEGKAEGGNPVVEIETTVGTIRAELFEDKAPKTVENFVDLVRQEFYDGMLFHRVIDGFMIQTGDPLGTGTGGRTDKGLPAKYLPDEFHPDLRHDKPGVLSMANSGPNTGDTQFFITTVPTPWLDDKHSVFGQVIEGMDVVRKIENVKTDAGDRPLDEVKMLRVKKGSGANLAKWAN
jgi:cyclophilin family peptidyl-prolyl cis-trans isomerase